jgi:hypothetical protein
MIIEFESSVDRPSANTFFLTLANIKPIFILWPKWVLLRGIQLTLVQQF